MKYIMVIGKVKKFDKDGDRDKFYSSKNLAKSIMFEAEKFLKCFQWENEHLDQKAKVGNKNMKYDILLETC